MNGETRELECLLVHFVRRFPRPVTRTEIVKLIYLFEYERVQMCGEQYTNVQFRRDNYGPFAPVILAVIDLLCFSGIVGGECYEIGPDRIRYEYRIVDEARAAEYILPPDEAILADSLIHRTRGLRCNQIRDISYETPPMVVILKEENATGEKALRKVIDMTEHRPLKRFTADRLKAAKERIHAESDRGTDEQYARDLLRDYQNYDDLRRRASDCALK